VVPDPLSHIAQDDHFLRLMESPAGRFQIYIPGKGLRIFQGCTGGNFGILTWGFSYDIITGDFRIERARKQAQVRDSEGR
jgi:hypothetical protein